MAIHLLPMEWPKWGEWNEANWRKYFWDCSKFSFFFGQKVVISSPYHLVTPKGDEIVGEFVRICCWKKGWWMDLDGADWKGGDRAEFGPIERSLPFPSKHELGQGNQQQQSPVPQSHKIEASKRIFLGFRQLKKGKTRLLLPCAEEIWLIGCYLAQWWGFDDGMMEEHSFFWENCARLACRQWAISLPPFTFSPNPTICTKLQQVLTITAIYFVDGVLLFPPPYPQYPSESALLAKAKCKVRLNHLIRSNESLVFGFGF